MIECIKSIVQQLLYQSINQTNVVEDYTYYETMTQSTNIADTPQSVTSDGKKKNIKNDESNNNDNNKTIDKIEFEHPFIRPTSQQMNRCEEMFPR